MRPSESGHPSPGAGDDLDRLGVVQRHPARQHGTVPRQQVVGARHPHGLAHPGRPWAVSSVQSGAGSPGCHDRFRSDGDDLDPVAVVLPGARCPSRPPGDPAGRPALMRVLPRGVARPGGGRRTSMACAQRPARPDDGVPLPVASFDPGTGVATSRLPARRAGRRAVVHRDRHVPGRPAPRCADAASGGSLDLLHVVAGVSYYKVGAPPRHRGCPAPVPAEAVGIVHRDLHQGLAEYAYRNDLPHVLLIWWSRSPAGSARPPRPVHDCPRGGRCRRSAAARTRSSRWRSLRAAGLDPVPFSVNPNPVIVRRSTPPPALPALAARRKLDPQLFELNEAGALQRAHPGHRDQLADRDRHRGAGTGSGRW